MVPENILPLPKQNEKKFVTNTTKFTLLTYWEKKKDGSFYTIDEISKKFNRKYEDSWDYINTDEGRTVTRHDMAYNKILAHCHKHVAHAFKMLIYMNDFNEKKQYLIAKISNDFDKIKMVNPAFSEPNHLGAVFAYGLMGDPIETYDLIQRTIIKQ